MEFLKDVVETIFVLVGVFTFIYFMAYAVELAKQKVRRKMYVCDNCFEVFKKIKE